MIYCLRNEGIYPPTGSLSALIRSWGCSDEDLVLQKGSTRGSTEASTILGPIKTSTDAKNAIAPDKSIWGQYLCVYDTMI